MVGGERRWVAYPDLKGDDSDFDRLGQGFAASGRERRGPVGAGDGRLMRQRHVVDFAVAWIERHRATPGAQGTR